jgi:integrase
MGLSDSQIRAVKPAEKLFKLSDGGGLQLWVWPDGAKRWRLAYRFDAKQKVLAVGVYPDMGLKDARAVRETAKRTLAAGNDPGAVRKIAKAAKALSAANTFEALGQELVAKKRAEGRATTTLAKVEWLLDMANSDLGARPIASVTAPEVLATLRKVEARGRRETARRMRAVIGEVFRYAVATGRADGDPTAALKGALAAPVVQHRAAIIEPKAFGALLRAISGYEGSPETAAALSLLSLTLARPGELRKAEWTEFNFDAGVWSIPAARMKMRRPHRVPLSPRALGALAQLRQLTGKGRFVFPSVRSAARCMSENTINAALRRLGFAKEEMTGHGFRSSGSSILNESGLWSADAIERQLAHVDNDSVRRAYSRADYWDERVRMMDWWANRCDQLKRGGEVVALRG